MKIHIPENKLAQKIFSSKRSFHENQAKLPIEEKILTLIKMQKIVLEIKPKKNSDDKRIAWEL
jgi:hypothetical protein